MASASQTSLARPAKLAEQPGGQAYVLLDGAIANASRLGRILSRLHRAWYAYIGDYRHNRRDICHKVRARQSWPAGSGTGRSSKTQLPGAMPRRSQRVGRC
jgi:hypothetical protein